MKKITIFKHNLLRATMTLALIVTCATAWAQTTETVSFIDADGIEKTVTAIVLDGTETDLGHSDQITWYVVNWDINHTGTIFCTSNVNLILADGKTMTVNGNSGNAINGSDNLTIYGQTNGTGTLNASCNFSNPYNAAVRSDQINIYGGKVNATASGCGYAIYVNTNITISGGQVTATASGTTNQIAIFAGNNVTISGGQVTATANTQGSYGIQAKYVNISGGQVTANGYVYGIKANTSVTLDWSNTTDFIYANKYYNSSNISIAEGKYFKDANSGNVYCGNVGNSINGKTLIPATQADYVAYVFAQNVSGSGTAQSPYLISTTAGWNAFCDMIEIGGESFSGKTVKLGANIGTEQAPITRMAGSSDHRFGGTFNGQGDTLTFTLSTDYGHIAPFRYVQGTSDNHAIITNLNVISTITVNGDRHLSGLISHQSGHVDVTNCNAEVNLSCTKSTTDHELYPAGLVSQAAADNNGTLTISGCTVTGTITTNGKYAAGLVGVVQGTATIEDCVSSVTINSSTAGDGTHGGLVAVTQTNSTTTIEGCLFNGKLLTVGTTETGNCGGILGWKNATVTIKNTLYAPATTTGNEHEVVAGTGDHPSGTFYRGNAPTLTNCYYTRILHNAQGKELHSITAGANVTVGFSGTPTEYTTSGITAYKNGNTQLPGLKYGNVLYAGSGDAVSLTLGHSGTAPLGYNFDGFTVNAGTLENNVLTMPDENVTVSATLAFIDWATESNGDAEHPYMIYNKDQLNLLAYRVNGTHDEPRQSDGYSGKYFKLGADITYSHEGLNDTESNYEAIGGYYDNSLRYFRGHFDGDGHTVSGIRIYKGGTDNNTDCYQGLFSAINRTANIHDVTLADTYITGYYYIGGIAGESRYSNITRCHVTSTVTIKAHNDNSSYHGGIVGAASAGSNVTYCTSAATLTFTSNSRYYGAITGYVLEGTLSDNLVIGATVPATYQNHHGAICGDNSSSTLARNYYYNCTVAGVQNATGKGCDNTDITDNDGAVPGNARTVAGYGTNEKVGWTFIASPLTENTDPDSEAVVDIFSASEYDLYRLSPSDTMWQNYKQTGDHYHFNLENGRGYLYATQQQETVKFIGENNAFNMDDIKNVTLPKGFNLVGNPFPRAAYINKPYYTLNDDGSAVVTETSTGYISPCTGVVVQVENGSETVTFRTTPFPEQGTNNNGNLNIALTQTNTRSNALLDRTIVSFNEGSQLGKFYFGQQDANIYISQDGKEYAIVCASRDGVHTVSTMDVNFKANENGEYTITVNPEGVEMIYLHLIDNMTGADVDLLTTTEYTFNAKVTDYESRFKLVFMANGEDGSSTGSETFAFYSNGNWIIANEGKATLQVIDLTGRIVSSETINGIVSKAVNAAPGVYMIRIINGEKVKMQKIMVK